MYPRVYVCVMSISDVGLVSLGDRLSKIYVTSATSGGSLTGLGERKLEGVC